MTAHVASPESRGRRSTRWLRLSLVLLVVAACARHPAPPGPAGLAGVPWPDLSSADPAVRAQIEEQRLALDRAQAHNEPAAAIADRFAAAGIVFTTYEFLDAAETCFANATRLAPADYRYSYLQGYLLAMKGSSEPAAALLERSLALAPDHLAGILRLAEVRLDQGDASAAHELFERALARHPGTPAAAAGLGRALGQLGLDRAAAVQLERALELEPDATALHYLLSQVYRRLGEEERAGYHLARRGDLQVPIPDPLTQAVPALARTADVFRAQAGQAMENQRYDIAATAYRRALERDPHDLTSYRGLAFSLYELGDQPGARAILEQALTRGRPDPQQQAELHRLIGEQHVLAARDDLAIAAFTRALAVVPERADARRLLANALARRGRFADSLPHYEWLLRGKPADADLRVRYASALFNLGRTERALAQLARAEADAPDDPAVREARSRARGAVPGQPGPPEPSPTSATARDVPTLERTLLRARQNVARGDLARANELYRAALELAPQDRDARLGLASVLGHGGHYAEAAAQFRTVTEQHPRSEAAWIGETSALALGGDWHSARERMREALEVFPRHRPLAHALARLLVCSPLARDRNGALALELVDRLRAMGPASPAIAATRAMALAELGRWEDAVASQRTVTGDPRSGDPGTFDPGVTGATVVTGVTVITVANEAIERRRLGAYLRREPWVLEQASEVLDLLHEVQGAAS